MTDANGNDPTQAEFYELNRSTWIETGSTEAGWMYQKIADGQIVPLIIATKNRVQAMTYRQYCEMRDGRPYAEIVKPFSNAKMQNQNAPNQQIQEGA